jgi:DNA-binding NarL/FixJ family response regulator
MHNPAVAIRLDSPDPIAEIGVLVQLQGRPEVVIAGPQGRPAVAIAVLAGVDDAALDWLRELRAASRLPIVAVTGPAPPSALVALVEAGAAGILGRGEATAGRLVRAVQLAAAGRGDLPPALVRHLLDRVRQRHRDELTPRGRPAAGLTGREREVLRLLADGMSTREVAARLAYPERTVAGVVAGLMLRLNVRNRTQAVASAVRNGWV